MGLSAAAIRGRRRYRPMSGYIVSEDAKSSIRSCPECGSYRCKNNGIYKRRDGSGSCVRRWSCKECGHRFSIEYKTQKPLVDARLLVASVATHRECPDCKIVLPLSSFGKAEKGRTGRHYCRTCSNKRRADSQFLRSLSRYGITLQDYERILKKQNGACAICGQAPRGKGASHYPLVMDHCHKSGQFRGLLCDKCNLGLGNFNDDLSRLKAAVSYLQDFSCEGDV